MILWSPGLQRAWHRPHGGCVPRRSSARGPARRCEQVEPSGALPWVPQGSIRSCGEAQDCGRANLENSTRPESNDSQEHLEGIVELWRQIVVAL